MSNASIYLKLREREQDFKDIEEAKSLLIDKGFGISDGNYPVFSEVLEEPEHRDNPVVERLRAGERLEDITDKIASQRSNSLRFNKAERVAYNKRVEDLNMVVDTDYVKVDGALNICEYGGPIFGGIISGAIGYAGTAPFVMDSFYSVIASFTMGGIGMFTSAFINWEISLKTEGTIQRIKEKAKYIDNLLERDRRQIK